MTEDDKKMSAWGSKFAQYLTAIFSSKVDAVSQESPDGTDGPSVELAHTSRSCGLQVHAAEVVDTECSYGPVFVVPIALQTGRSSCRGGHSVFLFKLLKWWAQSVLIGVSEIVCGLRDDNGIVSVLRTFPTENIPIIAANEFSDGRVTCKRQTEDEYKFLPSWYTDNEPR
ncbi:DXO-like protein [Mya arenaria]|uniref:Decapping nuclease n=1 Tax=Mya arenaria TaxID=6604 RepID=A0ABY7FFW3_MYAAR|nr:DXO-like protein [Mya arenaria]